MAYLDIEACGADKGEKDSTYCGFGVVMMKSLKMLRMTRLRRLAINTPFARFSN